MLDIRLIREKARRSPSGLAQADGPGRLSGTPLGWDRERRSMIAEIDSLAREAEQRCVPHRRR